MNPSPVYRLFISTLLVMTLGCNNNSSQEEALWQERHLSGEFKEYWFNGEAEISSYDLEQSRYGENREGTAVLIFVTEDFLPEAQIKANNRDANNIPVLKLNATKKFLTGIYPYSIMQSTFLPLEGKSGALKITASIQEWCGQVYMQLNNRNGFEVISHSYFQGEGDQDLKLGKSYLENEIWTQLRVDPEHLPVGNFEMIPSMEFIRLAHIDIKSYPAFGEFFQDGELSVYQLKYPDLKREVRIYYEPVFPFRIEKWEETTQKDGRKFITTATKMAEIKSAYWNKNSNNDLPLRDKLNLN